MDDARRPHEASRPHYRRLQQADLDRRGVPLSHPLDIRLRQSVWRKSPARAQGATFSLSAAHLPRGAALCIIPWKTALERDNSDECSVADRAVAGAREGDGDYRPGINPRLRSLREPIGVAFCGLDSGTVVRRCSRPSMRRRWFKRSSHKRRGSLLWEELAGTHENTGAARAAGGAGDDEVGWRRIDHCHRKKGLYADRGCPRCIATCPPRLGGPRCSRAP